MQRQFQVRSDPAQWQHIQRQTWNQQGQTPRNPADNSFAALGNVAYPCKIQTVCFQSLRSAPCYEGKRCHLSR